MLKKRKMILQTPNLNEIRKQIQKVKKENPKEQIIVRAGDDEFNRKVLETKEVDILLAPESHNRKDFMKQRDSGLNEFLAKLAKKNNITIGKSDEITRCLFKPDRQYRKISPCGF